MLIIPFLALTSFPGSPQAPDSVLLRYKFVTGAKRHFQTDTEMKLSVLHAGENSPLDTSTKADFVQAVKSIGEDGSATLESKIGSIQVLVNGASRPVPQEQIDKPSTLRMSPRGQVDKINLPGQQGAKEIGLDLNEMQVGGQLPNDPVKVGQQWESSITLPMMGSIVLKNTLKSIDVVNGDVIATLEAESTIDMANLINTIGAAQKLKGAGTGIMHLTWTFDVTAGWIQTTHMKTKYDLTIRSNDPTASGAEVKESGTQTYDIKVVP